MSKVIREIISMSFYTKSEETRYLKEKMKNEIKDPLLYGPLFLGAVIVISFQEYEQAGITKFTFLKGGRF